MRLTTPALLLSLLLAAPAFANPVFDEVIVETSGYDGDQPAGLPLWQKVTISWEGEVQINHFTPFHSERFRGMATQAELEALERAVDRAKLGEGMPEKFSPAPWTDDYEVKSSSARLRGVTKGDTQVDNARARRLRPLLGVILAVAQRIVHPPALPAGHLRGRVEVRGFTTYLNLGGNRRYEVEPDALADSLEALDGEWVVVRGSLSGDSSWNREVAIDEMIEPAQATIVGTLTDASTLTVGGRAVALTANDDVTSVLRRLSGVVKLQGFLRSTARGPRSLVVEGVRGRMNDSSYPFDVGDEVLLVDSLTGGRYVEAVRLSDGRSRMMRRALIDTGASAGITSALSGLGD